MVHEFECSKCGQHITHESDLSTGYGTNDKGEKTCYQCIGDDERNEMTLAKVGERFAMYLVKDETATLKQAVTNWPNSLRRPVLYSSKSRTNWGLWRTDVWFKIQDECFWGYSIGDNTQILHVRKIKPTNI